MNLNSEVVIHAIKESKGDINGRAFSSTTFHCEVDLKENGAGRSMGHVTRPFKFGDASEYDKWEHLKNSLPIRAMATFEIGAAREDGTNLVLTDIKPVSRVATPTKAA